MNFKYFLNEAGKTAVQPKNKVELKKIIEDTIKEQGFNCDLNFIDTSLIKDMSDMFDESPLEDNEHDWYLCR